MACIDQFFPYDDMLSAENVMKDRVVEDYETLFERIRTNRKKKIVLLMHDRAFRKDHDANAACRQLYKLLVLLKQHQFSFGTISKYLMNE
jgi:peptidoglycan/xylan/chitin deacetylase (PgdA/CDA1 family)